MIPAAVLSEVMITAFHVFFIIHDGFLLSLSFLTNHRHVFCAHECSSQFKTFKLVYNPFNNGLHELMFCSLICK